MKKFLTALGLIAITALIPLPESLAAGQAAGLIPAVPDTGIEEASTPTPETPAPDQPEEVKGTEPEQPVLLSIPAIGLKSPVIPVGVNKKGEMDVPDGDSNAVGWYKYGTLPGNIGSAVIDAHVFAAFAKLRQLKAGGDIYVTDKNGQTLRFKVDSTKTYALSAMDKAVARTIFNRDDDRHLTLITCAGSLTRDRSTYDHRLVIYATLVQ